MVVGRGRAPIQSGEFVLPLLGVAREARGGAVERLPAEQAGAADHLGERDVKLVREICGVPQAHRHDGSWIDIQTL